MAFICRSFGLKSNCRLFCSNNGLNFRHLFNSNEKIQRVVKMLSENDFNEQQMNNIFERIGKYIIEEKSLTSGVIRETIECWRECLTQPIIRANQLDKWSPEDIDYDMSVDFNHVVSKIEPKLLLMNTNAIEFRINCIKDLGITGGSRDLWRVFVFAPNGYYLQSWTDFLKKYHYLNFRVLEWILDKKDKNCLHPHPLIRNAKVMEMDFNSIRSRYLFAQRTGLKTVSITNKLSSVEDINQIDLKALLLTPINKYLKLIAPNCSAEEYTAFETLLNESPVEDDEQIIEDMVELTASHNNFKKGSNKRKEEILETHYQIISQNE